MRNIVLKYGTTAGLLSSCLIVITMLIQKKYGFGSTPQYLGYVGIVLVFIPLYLGVRSYRENIMGGEINFMKALNAGIIIIVISSMLYAITWLIIYYQITPDFPEKYSAYLTQQIKASGKDLKDTLTVQQQMFQYKEFSRNPFKLGGVTFTEPLPVGLLLALVTAAILRKKPSTPELPDLS
jgi:Protein of unknown function (DUF4199)